MSFDLKPLSKELRSIHSCLMCTSMYTHTHGDSVRKVEIPEMILRDIKILPAALCLCWSFWIWSWSQWELRHKTEPLSEAKEYKNREAQTKVCSSARPGLEETPETENVSSLNAAERTSRNRQQEQTKGIRAQWINHFCQHAVDYNLDIGVLLFTLLAFQQEGKGLTLSISPTFIYF